MSKAKAKIKYWVSFYELGDLDNSEKIIDIEAGKVGFKSKVMNEITKKPQVCRIIKIKRINDVIVE